MDVLWEFLTCLYRCSMALMGVRNGIVVAGIAALGGSVVSPLLCSHPSPSTPSGIPMMVQVMMTDSVQAPHPAMCRTMFLLAALYVEMKARSIKNGAHTCSNCMHACILLEQDKESSAAL